MASRFRVQGTFGFRASRFRVLGKFCQTSTRAEAEIPTSRSRTRQVR